MLRCRHFEPVPVEWRVEHFARKLLWVYCAILFGVLVQALRTLFVGEHEISTISFILALVSACCIWALKKAASRPRVFEIIELFWCCVLHVFLTAAALSGDDTVMKYRRVVAYSLFSGVLPVLFCIRVWAYACFMVCYLVAEASLLMYHDLNRPGEIGVWTPFSNVLVTISVSFILNIIQNWMCHKLFLMATQLSAQVSALESFAAMSCDATCWLADKHGNVSRCDCFAEELFGIDMMDKPLTDLASTEEDRLRLSRTLAPDIRSDCPVTLLPITMNTSGGPARLDLFVVHNPVRSREYAIEDKHDEVLYFVGIRRMVNIDVPSQGDGDEVDELSELGDAEGCCIQENTQEQARAQLDELDNANGASTTSLPWTTSTDRIFSSAERQNDVGVSLAELKPLVEKERWFIPLSEVEVISEEVLGKGGYGSVVKGSFHGAPVAIKLPSLANQTKGLHQLSNELRILRHARHPNLVQFYGALIDVSLCHFGLVLEFVSGVSLGHFKFASDEHLGSVQRFQVINGAASALSYLHSRRPVVIHGDLKPDNALIEQRESLFQVKLLDFGLSRLLRSQTKPCGGTPRWMDPEVASKRVRQPHARFDIFSFGYLMYFIMTGKRPYEGVSATAIKERHRLGVIAELTWPSASALQEMVKELAETCLQSEQRPSANLIVHKLSEWWNGGSAVNGSEPRVRGRRFQL
eukprot:TRINITY_DN14535_c0_g1_i5.p1 TRINITY_DN14535_c0_g1~~TRINITY_DN14535_c0_g1_i5.p1  ORF type:complete len:695 (+),score=41.16 TRINITY_DN14535_c0_g1_i5:40-2124(+)